MELTGSSRPIRRPARIWKRGILSGLLIALFLSVIAALPADAATRSCSDSTPVDQRPLLRTGDQGSCVQVLQRLLAKSITGETFSVGSFDSKTAGVVKIYQARNSLVADGIVGPKTWRSLTGRTVPASPVGSPAKCGNAGKGVFLVFDDYPLSLNGYKALINEAARLKIGIGVAPNGQYVVSGRADISYARRAGMYPVDHSYDHKNLTKLSYSAVYREITTSGVSTKWGRPPYGALNDTSRRAYKNAGMNICLWTLDPRDWDGRSTRSAADYIIRNAVAGSTVVVHLNHLGTDRSQLSRIESGLQKRGIRMCSPNAGTTPQDWRANC